MTARTWRAMAVAVSFAYLVPAAWAAIASNRPWPARLADCLAAAVMIGTPLAVAAAVLAWRWVTATDGRDTAEQILGVATAGLDGTDADWGAAMRAELASIDDPGERRRFARSCCRAALRTGTGRLSWTIALVTGAALAIATFVWSRMTLSGGQGGIMGFTMMAPVVVLFVVAGVTARVTRSFRAGLLTGTLALLATAVGYVAVTMIEALQWQHVAGVYVMDGDAKMGFPLGATEAMLDPVSPRFLFVHLLWWAPWPVLGAALGSWHRLRRSAPADARHDSSPEVSPAG